MFATEREHKENSHERGLMHFTLLRVWKSDTPEIRDELTLPAINLPQIIATTIVILVAFSNVVWSYGELYLIWPSNYTLQPEEFIDLTRSCVINTVSALYIEVGLRGFIHSRRATNHIVHTEETMCIRVKAGAYLCIKHDYLPITAVNSITF